MKKLDLNIVAGEFEMIDSETHLFYSTLPKSTNKLYLFKNKRGIIMPAPLSKDLRERILIKHQKGKKPKEIQTELEIKSLSAVCAIIKRYEETGSIEPRPLNNGRPPKMSEQNMADLKAAVLAQPDITLGELKEQLNLPISISRICRILNQKLKLPYKKNSSLKKSKPTRRS
jgi:transposase